MNIDSIVVVALLALQVLVWGSFLILGGAVLYYTSSNRGGKENEDRLRRVQKWAKYLLAFGIVSAMVLSLSLFVMDYI